MVLQFKFVIFRTCNLLSAEGLLIIGFNISRFEFLEYLYRDNKILQSRHASLPNKDLYRKTRLARKGNFNTNYIIISTVALTCELTQL